MARFHPIKLFSALLLVATAAAAQPPAHWVATWAASPQANWKPGFVLPSNTPPVLSNRTVRQVATVSLGGRRIRVELSNAYGKTPVVVRGIHVARSLGDSRIAPETNMPAATAP